MATDQDLHIARGSSGKLHLAGRSGWTFCSRQIDSRVRADEMQLPVDADYCKSCLAAVVLDATLALRSEPNGSAARSVVVDADAAEIRHWDAAAGLEMGECLLAHLERHPAPDGSRIAHAIKAWGEWLLREGGAAFDILDAEAGDA